MTLDRSQLARLRALAREAGVRRSEGRFLVDGPVLLGEALAAGWPLEVVVAEPSADPAVLAQARTAGVEVVDVAPGTLERIGSTTTPHGVLAVAERRLADLPAAVAATDLAVVGVALNDPGNAGTLLRTAEAAGAGAVVLTGGSVDPTNPKCVRASAGALFHVPVVAGPPASVAVAACRAAGLRTLATTVRAPRPYDEVDLRGPVALVLGNEAHGLDPEVVEACDEAVNVPMVGRAESLNVGMTAAILLFEARRQRRRS